MSPRTALGTPGGPPVTPQSTARCPRDTQAPRVALSPRTGDTELPHMAPSPVPTLSAPAPQPTPCQGCRCMAQPLPAAPSPRPPARPLLSPRCPRRVPAVARAWHPRPSLAPLPAAAGAAATRCQDRVGGRSGSRRRPGPAQPGDTGGSVGAPAPAAGRVLGVPAPSRVPCAGRCAGPQPGGEGAEHGCASAGKSSELIPQEGRPPVPPGCAKCPGRDTRALHPKDPLAPRG